MFHSRIDAKGSDSRRTMPGYLPLMVLLTGLAGATIESKAQGDPQYDEAREVVELFYELLGRTAQPDQMAQDATAATALMREGYPGHTLTNAVKRWLQGDGITHTATFAGAIPDFVHGLGTPEDLRTSKRAQETLAEPGAAAAAPDDEDDE